LLLNPLKEIILYGKQFQNVFKSTAGEGKSIEKKEYIASVTVTS
jgi:hypothetical protein